MESSGPTSPGPGTAPAPAGGNEHMISSEAGQLPSNPQTNSHEKRKPKSLHEPTESMLAAQREFERRKHEINPEDDPFWEKRGGRNGKPVTKKEDIPEKTLRTLKETAESITPLPNNSRLLTPTQATIFSSYHKEETPKEKHISALPLNSHLLTPTKASSLGEYHATPPPKDKQLTPRSNSGDVSAQSHHKYTPPPNSRLFDLTASCKNAKYEKKYLDNDPREDGWKSIIAPTHPRSPLPPPPEIPQAQNNLYKNVKSKLHNPTIASVRQQWCDPHEVGEVDDVDAIFPLQVDAHGPPQRGSNSPPLSTSSHNHRRFSHIPSRLLEPTAAHISSQWSNRPNSPTLERKRSTSPENVHIPAVQGKSTQAQLHNQRTKYVAPDNGDIGKKAPTANSKRSKSVPTLGRIYNPPSPRATERQASLRSPRRDSFGDIASPYTSLVNEVETPLVNRGRENEDDHSLSQTDREGENLFPEAAETAQAEAIEEVNPFLAVTQSSEHIEPYPDVEADQEPSNSTEVVLPQDTGVEPERKESGLSDSEGQVTPEEIISAEKVDEIVENYPEEGSVPAIN